MSIGNYCRNIALACLLFIVGPALMFSHQYGQTGSYQGGCGGGGCHGGQSGATTVAVNGPTSVKLGEVVNYTFTVSHQQNGYAGMNVAIRGAGGNAGALVAGNNCQTQQGELTHTQPTAMAGGTATFTFTWTAPNQPGTYTLYGAGNAVNHNGGADFNDVWNTTGGVNIVVAGAALTAPSGGASVCAGTSLTINWTQSGFQNFKVEASDNGFNNIVTISNSVSAAAGTTTWNIPASQTTGNNYMIRLVDASNGQEVARTGAFAIKGAPTFTVHPQTQSVCVGRSLNLTANADAVGAAYQWKKNGQVLPGQNKAGLSISVTTIDDAGSYTCDVTGCNLTATSNAATITMEARPAITKQPVAKTICENEAVSFTTDATGGGLNYQWQKNGADISGANGKELKLTGKLTDEAKYKCIVRGSCSPQAESEEVLLTILEKPIIATQPTNKSVNEGETLTLAVVAGGDSLTYQWKKAGAEITGATSATYSKSAAIADAGQYECVVKNRCNTVTSSKVTVTVVAKPGGNDFALAVTTLALGEISACAVIDTTLADLMSNNGTTALSVATIVSSDPSVVADQSKLPIALSAGGKAGQKLTISPKQVGAQSVDVTFTAGTHTKVLNVTFTAMAGLAVNTDTITLKKNNVGNEACVTVRGTGVCANATINLNAVTMSSGADAYEVSSVASGTIPPAGSLQLCVKTKVNDGPIGSILVATSAGNKEVFLKMSDVTSVEEELSVADIVPNPTMGSVTLRGLQAGTRVQIVSMQGAVVFNRMVEDSQLVWDGNASNGMAVANGAYVVHISKGNATATQLLHVLR